MQRAAEFYEQELGMERGESSECWIEVISGPLHLYLVDDAHGTPTFELVVDDVNQAMDRFLTMGCEETQLGGAPNERYIKSPFGQNICVSPVPENSSGT